MRTTSLTYDAVATECQKLFVAGENVSFQKIYSALGNRGSSRIVTEFIRQWRSQTGDMLSVRSERSLPGVPELLVQRLDGVLLETWQLALDEAGKAFETARGELELERGEWQVKLDTAAEQAIELSSTKATLAAREQSLAELRAKNQEEMLRRHALESQLTQLRDDRTQITERLAAEQHAHQESIARLQLQADERLAELAKSHTITLEANQALETAQRRQWAEITDELRQQSKAAETQMQAKLTALSAELADLQRRVSTATLEAATWKGRAESAEGLLTRMTTRKSKRSENIPTGD